MGWTDVGYTTWAATQASIAVLFVMVYGYAAKVHNVINTSGLKNISAITTSLFLPALFISEIGPEAELSKIIKYWPIIVFAVLNLLVSYICASISRRFFKSTVPFPLWIIPSYMFNNSITLMLSMLDSLGTLGAFDDIVGEDNRLQAIRRAKNYFLLNALVHSLIKFAVAPKLMSTSNSTEAISSRIATSPAESDHLAYRNTEEIPLISISPLPRSSYAIMRRQILEILNPPLLGAILAFTIGIIPPFRLVFLENGGIFTSTLTQSVQKMGNMYATMQVFVLGAQLYSGTQKSTKRPLPKFALICLLTHRFIIMPIFSISMISSIRRWSPDLLLKDPIFDFALMIAPVGPPSTTIAALAEIAALSEDDTSLVAYMLMISYIASPLISVPIACALTVITEQSPIYSVAT